MINSNLMIDKFLKRIYIYWVTVEHWFDFCWFGREGQN